MRCEKKVEEGERMEKECIKWVEEKENMCKKEGRGVDINNKHRVCVEAM